MNDLGIIILAAGSSTRMGQSKQLLPVHGVPLLLKTVNVALNTALQNIVVVLGAHEHEHRAVIADLKVDIVYNERWETGMGSSIKAGLRSLLQKKPSLSGVIILVCDQPLLTPYHILELIARYMETSKPIVASGYANTAGVPVFFQKAYFDSLMGLADEQGAKRLIQQHPYDLAVVDFPQGEIDLDTPEDYRRFKESK